MNYRTFQIGSTIAWSLFFVTDFILYVFLDAVGKWEDSFGIKIIVLLIVVLAWILQMIDLVVRRKMVIDERMNKMQYKSSTQTLMFVLIYVLLVTMMLHDLNEDTGVIPIQWLWFIASSLYLLSLSLNSALYLYAEASVDRYED